MEKLCSIYIEISTWKIKFLGFFLNHEKTPQNSYQYLFFQFYIRDFFSKQKHLNLFFHITLTFAQINLDKWLAYVRKKMSGLIFFFAEFSNFFLLVPLMHSDRVEIQSTTLQIWGKGNNQHPTFVHTLPEAILYVQDIT